MHAVARYSPLVGLMLLLLAPLTQVVAVTAVVGQQAPDVSLPSIDSPDDVVHLADYRGKVVFLDFWSSWCAPCRRAMPHLDALREELPRAEFEVIGVNVDPVTADGRRFLQQVSVNYPVAADAAGDTVRRYGVDVLPAWFLIDAGGVVRHARQGKRAEEFGDLRAELEQLIEEDGIRQ